MQPAPTLALVVSGPRVRRRLPLATALLAVPLAFVGCRDPKVTTYTIPKEASAELPASAPAAQPAAAAPAMPSIPAHEAAGVNPAMPGSPALQTASGSDLTWTAPTNWQTKAAGMMRKATFVLADGSPPAELAVSAFPGDVGGEIANVNRWRRQVGLDPLSDAEAVAAIARLEANGLKIGVVDVAAGGNRLIGAMVPYQGAVWFFKVTGPDALVESQKPAFIEFLKTVKAAKP